MNLKSKKLLSLFLVFSLLALSGNLYAKKHGVDVIVVKKDGQELQGELIAVKESSLLLMGYVSGRDVSIDIGDIKVIMIKGKSRFLPGLQIGALVGGISGAIWCASLGAGGEAWAGYVMVSGLFAITGGLIGGLIGAAAGKGEKTIQIEGLPDNDLKIALRKLRSKARVPDAR